MRGRRSLAAGLVVIGCIAVALGCQTKVSYPGAVYANALPMFKTATYRSAMGGSTGQGESKSWFFEFTEPRDQVVAFYEKALPQATKEINDVGEIEFTVIPEGAEDGEQMMVIIRDDEIQIHESVRAGKYKD